MIIYNKIERWENIPDPATLEAMDATKKQKKSCSATRGTADGWKEEGKQMYYRLVKNIKKLREDPIIT